jgi:hypothetical protein
MMTDSLTRFMIARLAGLTVIYQFDPATRTGRNLMWEPLPFVSVADDAFTIND